MASKILNVRMQEDLHADFTAFCKSIHIPASTLMAAFAAQTVRLGRVPFDIYGSEIEADTNDNSAPETDPKPAKKASVLESDTASNTSTKPRAQMRGKHASTPADLSAMIPRITDKK